MQVYKLIPNDSEYPCYVVLAENEEEAKSTSNGYFHAIHKVIPKQKDGKVNFIEEIYSHCIIFPKEEGVVKVFLDIKLAIITLKDGNELYVGTKPEKIKC